MNMTVVVSKKDMIKYGIKLIIFILILFVLKNIINNENINANSNINSKVINYFNIINNQTLLSCIEENIPVIKQINREEREEKEKESIEPLKKLIEYEIPMISNLKEIEETSTIENNENYTDAVEHAQTEVATQVIENNVPETYTNTYNGVEVKNSTEYQLTEEILSPNVEIGDKNILIFHTHTCESYTPTEKYNYEQTGTFRTTDLNYSVAKVGEELDKQLTSYGYSVTHDMTYHDYPAYDGSYGRSLETVKNLLLQKPNTDIVIDLHRDAIADYSYAPTVKIGDDYASQLMFVIGTDGGGLEHPNWKQNLKFAVKVQEKANELYPGLFKPIILRNSRYNQHLAKGACIIEVGATGNTLEQSMTSMKYLARVLDEILK